MKEKVFTYNKEHGSAIIVTMILTFVIAIMVAGAIRIVSHELVFSTQSSNWAQTIHSAEAGVEVGLAALQQSMDSGYDWLDSGWSLSGDVLSQSVTALSPTGHDAPSTTYNVTIDQSDSAAYTVTATGTMAEPKTGGTVSRTVRVTLEPDWFRRFERGMLGRDDVDFQGNPNCDSYDSTVGPYGGGNVSDNCPVASMKDDTGGIAGGGSPTINGDVYVTEDGDAVGEFWTGDENKDLDVDIPSYVPSNTAMTADFPAGMTGGETITVTNTAPRYVGVPYIAPKGKDKWINIEGQGELTLYVAGDTDFGTATDLNIIPNAGQTLEVVIVSNGDLNLKGALNKDGDPLNLLIMGTENCDRMEVEANNDKYLCVYAPDAEVQLSGTAHIFGSIVGKSLDVQGNFSFHYDESLANRDQPILVGWDIASWEEL